MSATPGTCRNCGCPWGSCLIHTEFCCDACNPDRCQATFSTRYGDRRCDLAADHGGYHIRNDACGRPEYYWGQR